MTQIREVCSSAMVMALLLGIMVGSAQAAEVSRGRLLYENHCVVCHTAKVHRREPPLPVDLKDLRRIVSSWAKEQNLRWSDDDVSDVVAFLSQTQYNGRLKQ